MRKLLLQLDSSRLPSVFDRVVAYDGGADEVMSYGGIVDADVRDLIHGCIFTRGPKDLKNTAVFVGGADIAVGEQLLAAATKAMFNPFTVSAMLDSNGSNTTAVAAVAKMVQAAGSDVRGKRVLIVAGTGPVGIRAAGLFAKAGADVCITSRKADAGERARDLVLKRFGGTSRGSCWRRSREPMPRVIGIDPGTVSIDLCGLDDGRLFLERSWPTAEALADPARLVGQLEAAGPLDLVAGPSGYGLPLTRVQDATEEDLLLAFLAAPGETGG